eukprot:11289084-Prorocentrum_lima.AAC.1
MTSSLVGSEMCIRDSLAQAAHAAEHDDRQPVLVDNRDLALWIPKHEGPVSYTHLTLPTICSV